VRTHLIMGPCVSGCFGSSVAPDYFMKRTWINKLRTRRTDLAGHIVLPYLSLMGKFLIVNENWSYGTGWFWYVHCCYCCCSGRRTRKI
jgi:hypothetical protein